MLDDLITRVRAKVDSDYRAVVIATGNSDQVKVDRIVDALTHVGRSLDQFAADVQRVIRRRELAARLSEVAAIDDEIAMVEQELRDAHKAETDAKLKLDRLATDKTHNDTLETELALNAAKHRVADASAKRRVAFDKKTGLLKQRERLHQDIIVPLEATAQHGADPSDPEAFAIT